MMKRSTYIVSLILFLSFAPANLFGKSLGYVWIAVNGYTEAVNYASKEMNFVFNGLNGVPDINNVVTLKSGNRIYYSYAIIEKIHEKYVQLLTSNVCTITKASTTAFMLNIQSASGCAIDNILDEAVQEVEPYSKHLLGKNRYKLLKKSRDIKVLGYVHYFGMNFMMVEW